MNHEGPSVVGGEHGEGAFAVGVVGLGVDGQEAVGEIMRGTPTPIVIISGTGDAVVEATAVAALAAGALAALPKPAGPSDPAYGQKRDAMIRAVRLMAAVRVVRHRFPSRPAGRAPDAVPPRPGPRPAAPPRPAEVVAIAASTGGPAALAHLLGGLPPDLDAPVLVVQHMSPGFVGGLASWLSSVCPLPVRVTADRERLVAGVAYLAPADHHLGVGPAGRAHLSNGPAEDGQRPSANHLFRSVAATYGDRAVAVILTGMGRDGADSLTELHRVGGFVIAQDEATSVVWGMPGAAVAAGAANLVLPLEAIGAAVVARTGVTPPDRPARNRMKDPG